jgi:hypothetical protein
MAFALDSTGLSTQTQEEIALAILARLQTKFGGTLDTTLASLSGQFANIVGEELSVYQQLVLLLYRSFDPNAAVGVQLDQRAALTGSVRQGETFSTVEGVLTATGACNVPDGTMFQNVEFDTTWQTINGPYVFGGAGTLDAQLEAVESGPLAAMAGNTWTNITIIANLTGFTNPVEDATVGRTVEADPAFRYRRTTELFARGNGPLLTISAVVARVPGVLTVRTFHNPSENPVGTDPNRNLNIPFKATNVVVETSPNPPTMALQQLIWDAIWSAAGGGVEAYGTDYVGTSTDVEGQTHQVAFDVVQLVDVFMTITITTSNNVTPIVPLDPATMAVVIRDQVVAVANSTYAIPGRDFLSLDYVGVITAMITDGTISGIASLSVGVGLALPAVGTSEEMSLRQKIDFDSGECQVIINGTQYLP